MGGLFDEAKELEKKLEQLAKEHPEQAEQGIDRAAALIDSRTGRKHSAQIRKGATRAKGFVEGLDAEPKRAVPRRKRSVPEPPAPTP